MAKNNNNVWLWLFAAGAFILASSKPNAIGKPVVFKRQPVYVEPGKTNLRFTNGKAGCYIIYENGKKVYVGHSTYNLYKTITRHFQNWDDKLGKKVTYSPNARKRYHITVIFTTPKQAASLEYQLIKKFLPRDNTQKYPELWPDSYDKKVMEDYKEAAKELEDAPF